MTDKPLREPWPSVVGWPYFCDKCGEKNECFTGCGLAECAAVAIRESRPTPPQDAEAVARHALDRCYEGAAERGGYDVSAYCEARDAYREAVERRVRAAEVEPCDWHQDSDGLWWTDCGNVFEFNEDGPWMNGMKFCGYCGKKLVEVPYEPMPDDDEEAQP